MTCRELIEFLMEYLDGELPEETRREFDRHLAVCPDCVRYLESYRETIRLEKAAKVIGDEPLPTDVPSNLVRAILKARQAGG